MDINNAASSRADYYDRNAVAEILYYLGEDIAPAGASVRGTYTTPANKKTILNSIDLTLKKYGVAASIGVPKFYIAYTPSGGVAVNVALVCMYTNVSGDADKVVSNPGFTMYPGDKIDIVTFDNNTGGSMYYIGCVTMTEFDF